MDKVVITKSLELLLREIARSPNTDTEIIANLRYRGAIEGIANVACNLQVIDAEERDLWVGLAEAIPMAVDRTLIPGAMKNTAKRVIEESQGVFLLESTSPNNTQISVAVCASKVGAQIDMALALGLVDQKDVDTWLHEVRSFAVSAGQKSGGSGGPRSILN